MQILIASSLAQNIEEAVYEIAKILFYPILLLTVACLIWVLVELGYFLYEAYLRIRCRDLEALEIRTLKARDAFDRGQPRRAYRYLQENNYSVVVARFLFDLIRNYQTQRLPVKPLKLLQEYEFFTVKRLERTRILVRVGPLLGLMGALIPLAPALQALADGDTQKLADNLTVAFSVTVLGLLIGGLAFMISIIRDRFYSQDISDLEYLMEILEGDAAPLRVGKPRQRKGGFEDYDDDLWDEDDAPAQTDQSESALTAVIPADVVRVPASDGSPPAAVPPQTTPAFVAPAPVVPGPEGDPAASAPDSPSAFSPVATPGATPAPDDRDDPLRQ